MAPNDSEGKLSPILLKRKADEKEVTIELRRLEKILDARINNLEVLTDMIKTKTAHLTNFENTFVINGFLSGKSTECLKNEKLRGKIKKEIEVLLEEERECRTLLDNAKNRFNEIQDELYSVFLSRKAVERLEDVRSSLSNVLRESEEDYGNEESFNQIKKDK